MKKSTCCFNATISILCLASSVYFFSASAQVLPPKMAYQISVSDTARHVYHVELIYRGGYQSTLDLKMCAWTPGFYEIIDFAGFVKNFSAAAVNGQPLTWKKSDRNTWRIKTAKGTLSKISYDVVAENPFIAYANVDKDYGYILPGALFMYSDEALKQAVQVKVIPWKSWPQRVVTGLTTISGKPNTFLAKNFDELYDSPFLMGKLELISSLQLGVKPVSFFGYALGTYNRAAFSADLYKIVKSATDVIGKIPFDHYSFLAIGINGNGFGGIEHLNSASLLVSNKDVLADTSLKLRYYHFLAHEFFHTYNVKRIRPIALGPFDYSKENYTNMLWVSEGFTDYYANLILNRAGLMSPQHVFSNLQEQIRNYENSTGHLYQSATQASRGIWAQRGMPTERTPEETAKTISVYDKGSALGLLLDLKIRHESKGARSLDNAMRNLYSKYFEQLHRGFTDQEFRNECEIAAGSDLSELFSYASTVKPVNYNKYLNYAGLSIDTNLKALPVLSYGAKTRWSAADSSLMVNEVIWNKPGYLAGLKKGDKILALDGKHLDKEGYQHLLQDKKPGDKITLTVLRETGKIDLKVVLETEYERSFKIARIAHPSVTQNTLYHSWVKD